MSNIRNWFTCKIKYHKIDEHGKVKKVNEPYLVDAVNFTEAEARIHEEIGAYISGDFSVTNITKSNIAEIFHYEDSDVWYKSRVSYVDFDEESGREKKVNHTMIATAKDVKEAFDRLTESLKSMLVDFEITQIAKSPIVDIFPYIPGEEATSGPMAEAEADGEAENRVEPVAVFDKPGSEVLREDAKEEGLAIDEMVDKA